MAQMPIIRRPDGRPCLASRTEQGQARFLWTRSTSARKIHISDLHVTNQTQLSTPRSRPGDDLTNVSMWPPDPVSEIVPRLGWLYRPILLLGIGLLQ